MNKWGIVILFLILFFTAYFLTGCKNLAYNRVSTDTEITTRNRKLLLSACDKQFPQMPPQFIQGETVIKFDTIGNTDTVVTFSKDTIYLTAYKTVLKTITRVDTIKAGDSFKVIQLIEQGRDKDKQIDKLDNKVVEIDHFNKTLRKRAIWGWLAFASLVIINGVVIYFKLK